MAAPAARPGPPTLHRLQPGRLYRIHGRSGCEYLGQAETSGQHWFRTGQGTESYSDDRMTELMQTGRVTPEGWS